MKAGYFYIVLATVLFSTMEIALKTIALDFNPVQINLIRFFVGALVLLPLALKTIKKKGTRLKGNDLAFFALSGFIGIVVSMSLYQLAILLGHASIVAVIFSCNPIFVVPFAYILLKEKVYFFTVLSSIVSLVGIVCIMNPAHLAGAQVLWCIILTILSAISFALYGVIGKTRSQRYGGVANTSFSFLAATLEMLIIVGLSWIPEVAQGLKAAHFAIFAQIPVLQGIAWENFATLAYVCIFVTGIGYAAYFLAIEKTSAATASLVFYIKPALAPILALLLIGEVILPNTWIGIVFIVIGSAIGFIGNIQAHKRNRIKN